MRSRLDQRFHGQRWDREQHINLVQNGTTLSTGTLVTPTVVELPVRGIGSVNQPKVADDDAAGVVIW